MANIEHSNVSRRKALKLIAASTGAVALSSLPGGWSKPSLTVGVLPAHAQISAAPYSITRCAVTAVQGSNFITPFDLIDTIAVITPAAAGIQLRRRITLNEPGHPQDGEVDVATAASDAAGLLSTPFFDLSSLSPQIASGPNRISVLWEFVDPAQGVNTCANNIEIIEPS